MSGDTATDDWAWMVCLGSFIIMVLETGMVKALGVLLPSLQQQFATKTWIIGLMISIVPGIGAVTCPLAGALSKRFSARFTVIIFCIISSLGLIVGYLASSVYVLSISFTFTGFGFGAEAIITGEFARYFDDTDFRKASAIARIGGASGVIIMPLVTQFLNDIYGWRGTMLILGGINLHCVISGVLLRPITSQQHESQDEPHEQHNSSSEREKTDDCEREKAGLCRLILSKILYYLDLDLFANAVFLTRLIYIFGTGYIVTGWLIYLVPFAINTGFSPYKAAFLATVGGIGALCGYAAFPLVPSVLSNTCLLYLTAVSNFLFLLSHAIFGILHSYVGLIVASVGLGVGRALGSIAGHQIAKESFKDERMTNAFMWFFMAYSLGSLLSGFLSGWIFDQTGSYTTSLVILSLSALVSVSPQPFVDFKHAKESTHYSPLPSVE